MKKYVLDYAADVTARIVKNSGMNPEHKINKLNKVVQALNLYKRGLVTTDEAIKLIMDA